MTCGKVREALIELDGIQDAFVGEEVVLHLGPGARLDEEAVRAVLEKLEVQVGDAPAREAPDRSWGERRS